MKNSIAILFIVSLSFTCRQKEETISEEYKAEFETFQQKLRKGRDHYLKLTGLHPLKEGIQSFGGSESNNIVLGGNSIPPNLGIIKLDRGVISCTSADEISMQLVKNDSIVSSWIYDFSTKENGEMLKYNNLEWMVIKRAPDYFLRVKDQESELAKTYKGFEMYPLQKKYVLEARFESFDEIKTETVISQKGPDQAIDMAGILSFELEGKIHQVLVGDSGFLIIGDLTNEQTTYGGGRYMYVDLPSSGEILSLDFNRLYNPPCVYSEFTTCPLPPLQNRLAISISAGEKNKRR